jgi:hypothetical protein
MPKPTTPKKPAGEQRDKAISALAAVLHASSGNTLYRHLEDLRRLLADEQKRIVSIPIEKRVALVRGLIFACGVTTDDLKPIDGGA